MKKTKQTFNDSEVIFREGDPSDTAFEIVSGKVEISKQGDGGNVSLAVLNPGDLFGEMGVLDQGIRSATATAVGAVTTSVISRKEFLAGVQDKPEIALGIMTQMAERLRGADNQLAGDAPGTVAGAAAKAPLETGLPKQVSPDQGDDGAGLAPAAKKGFLSGLFDFKDLPKIERIEVQVAPLAGDQGNKHTKAIVRGLAKRKGLRARMLKKPLPDNPDAEPGAQQKAREAAARKAMAETESDLLIWGEVMATGLTMHLKFIPFATWNDAPPGSFTADTILPLPTDLLRRCRFSLCRRLGGDDP